MTVDPVSEYGHFIKEAFIDPIRSVLIIDDDYPTVEQALESQINNTERKTYKNPEQILNVIKGFRNDNPSLIVDIHDGRQDVGEELAKHLHQSDLLILDYELEDEGQKAIEIAKKVFDNNHFNLIVVHTSSPTAIPFEKILLSLLPRCQNLNAVQISMGEEAMAEAEGADTQIEEKVLGAVGFNQYIALRHPKNKCALKKVRNGEPPFNDFHAIVEEQGWTRRTPNEVFLWAINRYEEKNKEFFDESSVEPANWSVDFSGGPLWIRTDKGFITFVEKRDQIDLLDELKTSLEAWGPNPSRLLSAKLRAVIDDQGVIAEDRVLVDKYVHAKFYDNLYLEGNEAEKRTKIDAQINRKVEHIANVVKNDVCNYLENIVTTDQNSNGDESKYQPHYGIDLTHGNNQNIATRKFNAYVSCYPKVNGWHLAPGHILDIKNEKWVCLSPICDLVPSQRHTGIYGDVGNRKPFFAVKLHVKAGDLESGHISSNNFIFMPSQNGEEDIKQYCLYEQGNSSPDKSVSPHWNLFIAENGGRFNSSHSISVSRISNATIQREEETEGAEALETTLKLDIFDCKIIAQLRYEYALNLMQKFGGEFTRVGLDYLTN